MALKFYGEFDELRELLIGYDVVGTWRSEPNGVEMLRCPDGSNLHWARGSKSLWIDGRLIARGRLNRVVVAAINGTAVTMPETEW